MPPDFERSLEAEFHVTQVKRSIRVFGQEVSRRRDRNDS